MAEVLIPKELLFQFAKKISANAVLIYITMLQEQNRGYLVINVLEIEEMTGISPKNLHKYIKELEDAGLVSRISHKEYVERLASEFNCPVEDFPCFSPSPCFQLNLTIWTGEGGFIGLPKFLLWFKSVEVDGKTIKLTARHRILMILHLILSENKGNSFAGREYLATVLGVKSRAITDLHNTLEECGIMQKTATTKARKGEVKTTNEYHFELEKIKAMYRKGLPQGPKQTPQQTPPEISDRVF